MAKRKKKTAKRKASKRRAKAGPKREPRPRATRRSPSGPAAGRTPAFTVKSTCVHLSGTTKGGRDESCVVHGAEGTISGFWVSAGVLKYAQPVGALAGRTPHPLTLSKARGMLTVEDAPNMEAVRFDLAAPIKLAKGETLSLRWRNTSGKRCAHYVACATKGR